MPAPLRLGLAGLGTVGVGVVGIVQRHADLISARTGRDVIITAVSARDRTKNRDADLSAYAWEADPVALAQRGDVDVFIEVMGGSEGPARDATIAAIAAGKDVVTANKALLAHHGQSLAEAAEAKGRVIRFEAAVAGGIPVIKALTEGLAGNAMRRVMGVMNGTCNYILTRMESAGLPYDTVFEEARQLGYLEADPNLDVGGIDAGHKLSLLAAIAFGTKVSFGAVELEDLPGRGRMAVPDLDMPKLALAEIGADKFFLTCHAPVQGGGHVMLGLLRTMADDYGALVLMDHQWLENGAEGINIHILEQSFSAGRRFDLAEKAG